MTKRALAVIGANFGDEGKGLFTDYLCATRDVGMVVRYNGGAQAGHTVVTPEGERHVFHHFGSGTLLGVPTFLSQYFVCNPLVALREADELLDLKIKPVLYVHPNCLVTTFADMMINQTLEDSRGDKRHGSVGMGFNETINRSRLDHLKITMSDLWNNADLKPKLREICSKYALFRTGKVIPDPEGMIRNFVTFAERFADAVHPLGIAQCKSPLFEGAQGLLLDQDNKEFFPHVTRSSTGVKNAWLLCEQAGITELEPYYVTRTYLTRHGAGKLPWEDPELSYWDNTNLLHEYQGKLRFAPLDVRSLLKRIHANKGPLQAKLVVTHCDQLGCEFREADFLVDGPTRNHVMALRVLDRARA